MNKALTATQHEFESSCSRTPEYLAWHRLFKREFTKFLTNAGCTGIAIGKPNHFDMSGFFTKSDGENVLVWYFSISDLREMGGCPAMLIRTAKGYKDYTGGMNQYISLRGDEEKFAHHFNDIVNRQYPNFKPIHHNIVDNINQAQVDYVKAIA